MQKGREFGLGYHYEGPYGKYGDFERCAKKWGYILTPDPEYYDFYFILQNEYDAYCHEINFLQGLPRFEDANEYHNDKPEHKRLKKYQAIEKDKRYNPNLKGSDFKSIGEVWIYDGRRFVKYLNVIWTGNVVNGMLDGGGDGYAVVKNKKGEREFHSFSGTFKNGYPCGKVTYANMYPDYDYWKNIFCDVNKTTMEVADFDGNMALFKIGKSFYYLRKDGTILDLSGVTAIKQNFKDGKAVVTFNGMDIIIDTDGKFVAITDGVTEIPEEYFSPSEKKKVLNSVQKLSIPNSVKTIRKKAFKNSNIITITIPTSVTNIEEGAFSGSLLLTEAIVPASLINSIKGKKIFAGCTDLKEVTVVAANGKIKKDNSWYWKEQEDPIVVQQRRQAEAKREAERAAEEARAASTRIENSEDFPYPDEMVSDLLKYDNNGRKYLTWELTWHDPYLTAYVTRFKVNDYEYYYFHIRENSVHSPSYDNLRDAVAGAYFYLVLKRFRTKGLEKGQSWGENPKM